MANFVGPFLEGNTAAPVTVDDGGGSLTVDGSVGVAGTVAVTGTVTADAGLGPFAVSDNGGSLTVDGTVAATQSGTWTVIDGGAGKTLKTAAVSLTTTGTAIAAVPTKRLKVYAVKLVVSAALSVHWRDGATTVLEGAQPLAANGGYTEAVAPPAFLFATTASQSLDLVISGTGTAAGRVSYWDDDGS